MKYALIDGLKSEATKGAIGICPSCGSDLIARCGKKKVNHWSHKSIRNCDSWWENETEWHRAWKSHYPNDWQETVMSDEITGEKHIADIRTVHGLVIEFQHSKIDTQERITREKFYKNMVWVVDGTRLKRDFPRFLKGYQNFKRFKQNVFIVNFPDEVFPENWLNCSVPVCFDFLGNSAADRDEIKSVLWCLLPQQDKTRAVVVALRRSDFIQITHNKAQLFETKKELKQQQEQTNLPIKRFVQRRGPLIDYIDKQHSSNRFRTKKRR